MPEAGRVRGGASGRHRRARPAAAAGGCPQTRRAWARGRREVARPRRPERRPPTLPSARCTSAPSWPATTWGAARVLARSFARSTIRVERAGPWSSTTPITRSTAANEPFEVVRPDELAIAQWNQMIAGYSVLELSTAVKPWLLGRLLDRPGRRAGHLPRSRHPGAAVRSSEVEDAARRARPRRQPASHRRNAPGRAPPGGDGYPHLGLLQSRLAGFAAGAEVDALLGWWVERLATDCLVAPERGYFVDQRWMDLAPGLIPSLVILRDRATTSPTGISPAGRCAARRRDTPSTAGRCASSTSPGMTRTILERLSKHQDRLELDRHPVRAGAVRRIRPSAGRRGARPRRTGALRVGPPAGRNAAGRRGPHRLPGGGKGGSMSGRTSSPRGAGATSSLSVSGPATRAGTGA